MLYLASTPMNLRGSFLTGVLKIEDLYQMLLRLGDAGLTLSSPRLVELTDHQLAADNAQDHCN